MSVGICGSDGAPCDRYTRYSTISTVYRYRYRNCTVLVARSEPLGVCDRSSHGRVRPNLSLSGQVSVGAKRPLESVGPSRAGHSRALSSDWTVPTSVVVVVFVPQRSEALVHVAEATSIVAEATTLISIYDGKNILSRLPQYVIYWLSQIIIIGGAL